MLRLGARLAMVPTTVALLFVLLLLVFTGAAFVAGYEIATARARRFAPASELAPPAALQAAPEHEPIRVALTTHAAEGTEEWRQTMAELGDRMRGAGVRLVVFSHGSFVGDDPLTLARCVEEAAPGLPELGTLARKIRDVTRGGVSRLLGDLSNYTADYVATFARATGVDAIEFVWSGENHHAARVHGATRLARAIALHGGGATVRPGDRVLLVGHSHGGQLFAILSQLVARSHGHEELVAAARARGEDAGALDDHLALLRACSMDVVTFGTPLRYGWGRSVRLRLLHVVNHRGSAARAPSLRGLLLTEHGDTVQQLGVHGSDFAAPTARERGLNTRLDRILGRGRDARTWLRHLAHGSQVSPHGQTVLVDYGDDARTVPNFLGTGLGHAAYTRRAAMLFHAQLVANHFYPSGAAEHWSRRVRRFWRVPARLLPPRAS
jgi:hypothetical protein